MTTTKMIVAPLCAMALSAGAWAQTTIPPGETPSGEEQGELAVSRDHAEQIALRHVPGRVEAVEQDTWNDEIVWEVRVESEDGQDYEVVINADNGRIVEVDG